MNHEYLKLIWLGTHNRLKDLAAMKVNSLDDLEVATLMLASEVRGLTDFIELQREIITRKEYENA